MKVERIEGPRLPLAPTRSTFLIEKDIFESFEFERGARKFNVAGLKLTMMGIQRFCRVIF